MKYGDEWEICSHKLTFLPDDGKSVYPHKTAQQIGAVAWQP